MTVPCPLCRNEVQLFKSRIFSKHAYPSRHPEAKALCPACGAINAVNYGDEVSRCHECGTSYDPSSGTVSGSTVSCPTCQTHFRVIDAVRPLDQPPHNTMYAKMILTRDGQKHYLPIDDTDRDSYQRAQAFVQDASDLIPIVRIQSGHNTDQILNYNYRYWHQLFNARQLASIAILSSEVANIADPQLRTLFAVLLSGTLEFNSMLCSFKGEGTGAVRHAFAHHILKPELMPLEANLWGTPKSSGAFSTLFNSKILRALDYKDDPFELKLVEGPKGNLRSEKVFGINRQMNCDISHSYREFADRNSVYLSCGDSSQVDIPDGVVDLVVTDPPFFDNVHYSELADYFYVWLRQMLRHGRNLAAPTTRSEAEVQDVEADEFASKLGSVLRETNRVLKDDGLLVFTYHHSRLEGWISVYRAVRQAGFFVTHANPVRAEMAVSIPIQQAKVSVNFDLVLVCRKTYPHTRDTRPVTNSACLDEARRTVTMLMNAALDVSIGDAKVVFMGCVLSRLGTIGDLTKEIKTLCQLEEDADSLLQEFFPT